MSEIGDDLLISLISRAAVNLYLSSNKELLMFPRTSCQRCLNFSLKKRHFRSFPATGSDVLVFLLSEWLAGNHLKKNQLNIFFHSYDFLCKVNSFFSLLWFPPYFGLFQLSLYKMPMADQIFSEFQIFAFFEALG